MMLLRHMAFQWLESQQNGVRTRGACDEMDLLAFPGKNEGAAAYGITVTVRHGGSFIALVRTSSSARRAVLFEKRERNQSRVLARDAFCIDADHPGVYTYSRCTGGIYCGAHRLPVGKTAARESSADVLPVRQRKTSKVDYYNCPRH